MKVNEITEGQIWNGVTQVAKGLGNVAGGVGMGALRALDKLGGGTGDVGTLAQRAEYKRQQRAREEKKLGSLYKRATTEFNVMLSNNNIDVNQLDSLPPNQQDNIKRYTQQLVIRFFSSNAEPDMARSISDEIKKIPVPADLSIDQIRQYFDTTYAVRDTVMGRDLQNGPGAQPPPPQQPPQQPPPATLPISPAGVQIISMPSNTGGGGGTPTNLVVRYRNQDFILMDNPDPSQPDVWTNLNGKPLSSALAKFLTDQISLLTP